MIFPEKWKCIIVYWENNIVRNSQTYNCKEKIFFILLHLLINPKPLTKDSTNQSLYSCRHSSCLLARLLLHHYLSEGNNSFSRTKNQSVLHHKLKPCLQVYLCTSQVEQDIKAVCAEYLYL